MLQQRYSTSGEGYNRVSGMWNGIQKCISCKTGYTLTLFKLKVQLFQLTCNIEKKKKSLLSDKVL